MLLTSRRQAFSLLYISPAVRWLTAPKRKTGLTSSEAPQRSPGPSPSFRPSSGAASRAASRQGWAQGLWEVTCGWPHVWQAEAEMPMGSHQAA